MVIVATMVSLLVTFQAVDAALGVMFVLVGINHAMKVKPILMIVPMNHESVA